MKPDVAKMPVPIMLATTKMVAEKKPISLLSSDSFRLFFKISSKAYLGDCHIGSMLTTHQVSRSLCGTEKHHDTKLLLDRINGLCELVKDLPSIKVKPVVY